MGEVFRNSTAEYAHQDAIIEVNREKEVGRFSYGKLREEAERIASGFQRANLSAGDRCAILMSNQAKWHVSATAAFWSGAVLVPLDYKLTPSEQLALISHAEPRALVTEWPIWMRLQKEGDLSALKNVTVFVSEVPPREQLHSAQRWEEVSPGNFLYQERGREDVACIVYSSGTGGIPKGCMLTHGNYLSQAEQFTHLYRFEDGDRFFSILPTNHAIDFMLGFIYPQYFGATTVFQRTLRPEFLAHTMKAYGINAMAMVPLLLKAIETKLRGRLNELPPVKKAMASLLIGLNKFVSWRRPHPKISRRLLPAIHQGMGGKLRLVIAGGAYVDPKTAQFFYDIGIPVAIGYGLTESGTAVTVNDLKPFRADTVGTPCRGTKIDIRNPNDQGIGEVWVQGPTVMKGYFKSPELSEETLVDGWLRTGDLGFLEDSGHLVLKGRSKNMIVTEGGKNIYPEDIEITFEDLPGCQEFCVFARNYVWPTQNFKGDELLIVLRTREKERLEELLSVARDRNRKLADFKRLSSFLIWEEDFPRTASMKVKREKLARALEEKWPEQEGVQVL